jgi:hypothetical protein
MLALDFYLKILDENRNKNKNKNNEVVPFEMIVLDTALNVTTLKFHRNLSKMKPIFTGLVAVILSNPCEKTLKKLHAFRKSLLAFENK